VYGEALADVLIDCVEGGASVSFMLPISRDKAPTFWRKVADGVARGERVLLIAQAGSGEIVGTVQIVLSQPENQPHRADVAKMLVHRKARETRYRAVTDECCRACRPRARQVRARARYRDWRRC
jgi:hypothetical protein